MPTGFFALFKSIFLRYHSLSNPRWFSGKKCKIRKGNLYLTENWFSRNKMWCAEENHSVIYVTGSRGMSRMSGILILSYTLKEVINFHVLRCFWIKRIVHLSATRCPIQMGFRSKCSILNGQVIYIKKFKLNIADMWLIPLDRVTYVQKDF